MNLHHIFDAKNFCKFLIQISGNTSLSMCHPIPVGSVVKWRWSICCQVLSKWLYYYDGEMAVDFHWPWCISSVAMCQLELGCIYARDRFQQWTCWHLWCCSWYCSM